MGVLVSAMSALSVFHPDANPALRVSFYIFIGAEKNMFFFYWTWYALHDIHKPRLCSSGDVSSFSCSIFALVDLGILPIFLHDYSDIALITSVNCKYYIIYHRARLCFSV